MIIVHSPAEMRGLARMARARGDRIALVPTMGYLHEGHLSLMREGRARASILVVSVFVNPAQFGPGEDFARYPRDAERDRRLMDAERVDLVFAPSVEAMYAPRAQTWVEVSELTRDLCGRSRPGHFRGVTTVVAKLFNTISPDVAIFGAKDYQQLLAIRRMVLDLAMDVEVVAMPTVREAGGLAVSSRNAYLSPAERKLAPALYRALEAAAEAMARGERDPRRLVARAREEIAAGIEVEYLEVRDAATLAEVAAISAPVVIAIAARIGRTRLIDNMVLAPDGSHLPSGLQ